MNRHHPLVKALREARGIILGALLVAVGYNVFASTGMPWIREVKRLDTASFDELVGGAPIDTTSTAGIVPIDTAAPGALVDTALLAEQRKLEEKRRLDSIARAKAIADSMAAAAKTPNTPAEPADTKIKEVSTSVAKQIFEEKRALFIDARPADQYAKGHIPGAINIYANKFQDHIPDLLQYDMNNQLVLVYCGGGLCELSHELAEQLRTLGFKRIVVYTGGTADWTAQNLPFTSGE